MAKEFNNKKCDDLFAGTPLVEAMRAIISMVASGATPKTLMTVGVSRAYMYAKCRNEMYVEMCPEAYEEDGDEKCCWRLEKAMYGTRSAAQDWQHEIKRRMLSIGYMQGKSNPCLFLQPSMYSNDFDTVTNNLCNAANGTFVTFDDFSPLTEVGKILTTQASVCTMVFCISRHDK